MNIQNCLIHISTFARTLTRGASPTTWCGPGRQNVLLPRQQMGRYTRRRRSALSHGCAFRTLEVGIRSCCDLVTSATRCCERCATVRLYALHGWASMQRVRSLPPFQWETPLRSVSQKALDTHVNESCCPLTGIDFAG